VADARFCSKVLPTAVCLSLLLMLLLRWLVLGIFLPWAGG
jgi:hypothetical protein